MSEKAHRIESLVAHLLILLLTGLQSSFVCLLGFTLSFFGLRKLICQQTISREQHDNGFVLVSQNRGD